MVGFKLRRGPPLISKTCHEATDRGSAERKAPDQPRGHEENHRGHEEALAFAEGGCEAGRTDTVGTGMTESEGGLGERWFELVWRLSTKDIRRKLRRFREQTQRTQHAPHSGRQTPMGQSFGMNWNETGFLGACKLLKMWWPGTESNRRRQPFQGCALPAELPGHLWKVFAKKMPV